jgi:predicted RNA-binding protein YlxR (DUF448 family)
MCRVGVIGIDALHLRIIARSAATKRSRVSSGLLRFARNDEAVGDSTRHREERGGALICPSCPAVRKKIFRFFFWWKQQ